MDVFSNLEKVFPPDILRDILNAKNILLNHGAKRIILYGSIARGSFTGNSDIDLCVEGLPDKYYFRALAECLMESTRRISVIDLSQATGYLKKNILREGKILYEA